MHSKYIFIISQPRSGSTLLQRMLHQHSEIATVGEPWMLLPIFRNDFDIVLNKKTKYNSEFANTAISEFLKNNHKTMKQEALLSCYKNNCRDIIKSQNSSIFLDKTPRYYYIIDEIVKFFPEAKFIILTRNPLDVFNSILNTWVKSNYSFLKNFLDDLFVAPRMLAEGLKNSNIYHLKYENLISNKNIEIQKLCKYLEIQFESEMLNVSNAKLWKFGDPNMNKKKKVSITSQDLWKQGITAQKWRLFNDYMNSESTQYHQDLGYDLSNIQNDLIALKPHKARLYFTIGFKIINSRFYKQVIYWCQKKKMRVIKKLKKVTSKKR